MASAAREVLVVPGRLGWDVTPMEEVGPLRFGMLAREVEAALPGARLLSRFQADPYFPEIVGTQIGFGSAPPAVYVYFDGTGRLFCVVADAGCGPQVSLHGNELTGLPPALIEQHLLDLARSAGLAISYGPRGNPGINGLGLVLRVQEAAGQVLTRPVLVGRDWAGRCTDDSEGCIPECEWLGRQWPHPRAPNVLPPAGHTRNWPRGWGPPF